ncbi:MAG: hypothetical protein IPJ21_10220 [Sterolibacteriaceae bacterium]|nr:hypothetical protein [Sterolibacteriaceae bacterium]
MINDIKPEIRRRAYAEQVDALFRANPMILAATLVAAGVVASTLYGEIPIAHIGNWIAGIFAVTATRFFLFRAYVRNHRNAVCPSS